MASTMRLDPDAVAGATFSSARRGYDPDEVRPFLRSLSDELVRLRRELDDARAQLSHRTSPMVDDASLAAALGEEAVRVLTTAREGAGQIRARAEESSAELIRDANEDATRLRREADLDATHRRQLATAEAEAAVEAAKTEGREMVAEARAVRERMLDDLARRRERARSQFEQLRQSYERVLRTFEASGGTLAAITEDLRAIGPEVGANATTLESSGDTGPVAIIDAPVVARRDAPEPEPEPEPDATGAAASAATAATAPAGAPPVVQVVVPRRDVAVAEFAPDDDLVMAGLVGDRMTVADPTTDETDDEPATEEGPATEPEPDVVVQALVLGELDRSMRPAAPSPVALVAPLVAAAGPEAEIDGALVEPGGPGAGPDDVVVQVAALDADADGLDADASTQHKLLPSAEDLFARIRAAREQLSAEVHEVISAAVPDPAVEPTAQADAVASEASVDAVPDAPAAPVAPTSASPSATVVTAADAVAARAEVLGPIEEAIARRLKRVLADEQNEVLDRLRKAKTSPSVDELVGDSATHAASYQQAVEGDAWAAAVAGARSLAADPDAVDEAIGGRGDLAAAIAAEVANQLVEPFRARLADTLSTHEPVDAAELLRAVYRDWKTQRIDSVSEQVACFAYGHGAFAALVPGTPVCWAVDPNGPGCPEGEDNTLGGPVAAGEAFPTGHRCTPAYAGCRCVLLPTAAR